MEYVIRKTGHWAWYKKGNASTGLHLATDRSVAPRYADIQSAREALNNINDEESRFVVEEYHAPANTLAGPVRHDDGKERMDLIPPEFLLATARALGFGAKKYAPGNWAQIPGFDYSRVYASLQRHLVKWQSGEELDPESGMGHLDHACCNLAFLVAMQARGIGMDDRVMNGVAKQK